MTSLVSPSPALLVSERGGPVASPSILAELQKIDPALGLRWIAKFEQSEWAVTWEWPQSDARWSRVRSQEIPRESAHDILGYLPVGCSVDEAKPYIESHLKNYPKEEISRLRAKVAHWNEVEVPKQHVSSAITGALDETSRQSREAKGQVVTYGKRGKR